MNLAPSTDLVMEVARAADPARAGAVVERLNALARDGAASPQDFSSALHAAASAPSPPILASAAPPSRAKKAETQFESVMLSEFIGEWLPKDAPSAFGQGYAGDMWRSMLAERVADQIAASGRLGLASRLFANHPLPGGAQTAQASANALSGASGAENRDGAFLFSRPL
jgi:flagellar protein FlgJ